MAKPKQDYAAILKTLNEKLKKLKKLGDVGASELEYEIHEFKEWVDGTHKDPVPVDLSKWGVDLVSSDQDEDQVEETHQDDDSSDLNEGEGDHEKISGDRKSTQEDSAIELDSPEEKHIHNIIQHISNLLDVDEDEEIIEGLRRVESLIKSTDLSPKLEKQANILLERAQRERKRRLNEALEEGKKAREKEDTEIARRAYERAIILHHGNADARGGLLALDHDASEALSQAEIVEIRSGFRAEDDIGRLENAVRQAEGLDTRKRLPDELFEELRTARNKFDELREEQGAITTQMHFGDLRASWRAVEEIKKYIATKKTIYDPIRGARTPADALQEANVYWRDRSNDVANHILSQINKYMPGNPESAASALKKALQEDDPDHSGQSLNRPFHEEALNKLENTEIEIKNCLDKQKRAEAFQEKAQKSNDPVDRFELMLQAWSIFNDFDFVGLDGIEKQVELAKRTAIQFVLAQMNAIYREVRANKDILNFSAARKLIAESDHLAARWPDPDTPGSLVEKKLEGESLLKDIDEGARIRNAFEKTVSEIKRLRKSKDTLPNAFKILDDLQKKPEYSEYIDLRSLVIEMDAYRGVDEQLKEAHSAASDGDWDRVFRITSTVLDDDKAGELKEDIQKLRSRADTELNIIKVKTFIERDEIIAADRIIRHLQNVLGAQSGKAQLDRLNIETTVIQRAKNEDPPFRDLYRKAKRLSGNENLSGKIDALNILRYIGGQTDLRDPDWPEYNVSLHTAKSRQDAFTISEEIHNKFFKPLEKAYTGRKKRTPRTERMRKLAAHAQLLSENQLIRSNKEERVIRWFDIRHGILEAREAEDNNNWDIAVAIWQELDNKHPHTKEIEDGNNNALREQAINASKIFLEKDLPDKALIALYEAQKRPALQSSWELKLALVDVHAHKLQYEDALGILNNLKGVRKCAKKVKGKRHEILRDQRIANALKKAQDEIEKDRIRQALTILISAKESDFVDGVSQLDEVIDSIFRRNADDLLQRAQDESDKHTNEGKVNAIKALIDLRGLEDVMKVAEGKRISTRELMTFRKELPHVTKMLMSDAKEYSPEGEYIKEATRRFRELVDRLDALSNVVDIFKEMDSELANQITPILRRSTKKLEQVLNLDSLLGKVHNPRLWEKALRLDDFTELNVIFNRIQDKLDGMSGILDVQYFEKKILEWSFLHNYVSDGIHDIQTNYLMEDFKAVIDKIDTLGIRPSVLPDNQPFSQVQQEEYNSILALMGTKLIVRNQDNKHIGWDDVRIASQDRLMEVEAWNQWEREFNTLKTKIDEAYQIVEKHADKTNLLTRLQDWTQVSQAAQKAYQLADSGAQKDQNPVLTNSKSAKDILNRCEENRKDLSKKLHYAQDQISTISEEIDSCLERVNIKSMKELLSAANGTVPQADWNRLERYLKAADTIGSSNRNEERQIRVLWATLERGRKGSEVSLLGRFKNRLGLK